MASIKLSAPIDGQGQKITEIEMREPRYGDYMELGAPFVWIYVDGGGFEQETSSITRAWVERLCDIDPNFLHNLNLKDTLALRNAVMRFFREAQEVREPKKSTGSPGTSSSDSDGTPGPSKI